MIFTRLVWSFRCALGVFSLASVLPATLAAVLFAATPAAHAGRPSAIDDATVIDANGCELETWMQKSRTDTEYRPLPDRNVNGNLELMPDAARFIMQAKILLKSLQANGHGAGAVIASQYNLARSVAGDLSVDVPVSFFLQDDCLPMYVNSGRLHKGMAEARRQHGEPLSYCRSMLSFRKTKQENS